MDFTFPLKVRLLEKWLYHSCTMAEQHDLNADLSFFPIFSKMVHGPLYCFSIVLAQTRYLVMQLVCCPSQQRLRVAYSKRNRTT